MVVGEQLYLFRYGIKRNFDFERKGNYETTNLDSAL